MPETKQVSDTVAPSPIQRTIAEILTPPTPKRVRYYAIIIKAEDADLGGIFTASTKLGDYMKDREQEILPKGCKITRSIEITEDLATRGW